MLTKNAKLAIFLFSLVFVLFSADSFAQHHSKDTTKTAKETSVTKDTKTEKECCDSSSSEKCEDTAKSDSKEIWNAYCPVMLGEIDAEGPTVEYNGKTIAFCCPGCEKKFLSDPEKYLKNLSEDGKSVVKKD